MFPIFSDNMLQMYEKKATYGQCSGRLSSRDHRDIVQKQGRM